MLAGPCHLDSVTVFALKFVKHVNFSTNIFKRSGQRLKGFFFGQMNTQHGDCETLHSLEVYRLCQIDDVQTAAERAVRDFYKELRG